MLCTCMYVTQGNGHERDFLGDERVFILDMYNRRIYPGDEHAKQAIHRKVELITIPTTRSTSTTSGGMTSVGVSVSEHLHY